MDFDKGLVKRSNAACRVIKLTNSEILNVEIGRLRRHVQHSSNVEGVSLCCMLEGFLSSLNNKVVDWNTREVILNYCDFNLRAHVRVSNCPLGVT